VRPVTTVLLQTAICLGAVVVSVGLAWLVVTVFGGDES